MTSSEKRGLVPKLRFPEFREAGEWELITLQQASVPVTERVGQRKLTPVSISAGIGFVPQAEKFGRDISGNQYQLYTLVSDGDFVYNKGNSLKFPQGCVYLLQGWGQVAAPNVFICFRLKDGYSNVFFQNCFEQNLHGKQLKKHITSGARSNGLLNISKENFFSVEIPTPSPPEQQKIADCLASLDELITLEAQQLDTLKTHKKGLMQQLFPAEGETLPKLRFPEFRDAGEWHADTLVRIAKFRRGSFPQPYGLPEWYDDENGVPFVQVFDVDENLRLKPKTKNKISKLGAEQSVFIAKGTLIVTLQGSIGRVAITQYDA
jgi:type I restriction enzyme S subunit